MQILNFREVFGPGMALQIECMGSIAISIANRWTLGWPELTSQHVEAGSFMQALETQMNLEKDVLAEETGLQHLSQREILQMHGVPENPPPLA
ncbi:MAG: hypothetical protein V4713_12275 [Pseudomonadota bacterium]